MTHSTHEEPSRVALMPLELLLANEDDFEMKKARSQRDASEISDATRVPAMS